MDASAPSTAKEGTGTRVAERTGLPWRTFACGVARKTLRAGFEYLRLLTTDLCTWLRPGWLGSVWGFTLCVSM